MIQTVRTPPRSAYAGFVEKTSLKMRVALLTLLIVASGISALSLYVTRALRQDMEQTLAAQQYSTVEYIAAAVNDEVAMRLNALQSFSGFIGQEMPHGPARLQAAMERRLVLLSLFNSGIFITGTDGVAIVDIPSSNLRKGVDYSDRDYIITALKEGRPAVGLPVGGRVLKAPVVVMAVPVRDPQGKIVGALAGVTNLSAPSFFDKITESRYGKEGGYLLVDARHRMVITASDRRAIMMNFPPQGEFPAIDRFINGHEGTQIFTNPQGTTVMASAKRLAGFDWYVSSHLPVEEAFSSIRKMQIRILVLTLLVLVATGGITWWMMQRQFSPLTSVSKQLAAMSQLHGRVELLPVQGGTEISLLIDSFNRLLADLSARENILRDEIARRVQAQAQAEEASRSKSAFLSSMSHELRTPLNAIMGYSQLMAEDPEFPAAYQDGAREIFGAGQRLLAMVNRVLDLAKLESGRMVLNIDSVPLRAVVAESMTALSEEALAQGVELQHASGPEALALVDRVRLKQVLMSLISNAIKFNHQGGKVVVSLDTDLPMRVRINVLDDGRGITAEQMQQLFQPFGKPGVEGGAIQAPGIGLAISRRIVQMMRGEIGVESTPGTGSRFWIELPVADDPVS